jgi:hypothetical protein
MILFWIFFGIVLAFGFVVAFGAPYVPSHVREVRRSFKELYPLGNDDTVVDLGSGDGLVLKEAGRRGAATYGFELNPLLVFVSRLRLLGNTRAHVALANMWHAPLPKNVTLVYVFTVSRDSAKLTRRLQSEADRLGRSFHVMTYGEGLRGHEPKAKLRGHTLYTLTPLQGREA